MPTRLRPTAPLAADAILVGDPGRALLLAQELLEKPKMSNHARGLWGYTGQTPAGQPLTIQATGMGGPSAALVLADLAKLGVRRAVRVGTCVAAEHIGLADLLLPSKAIAAGGSASSFGLQAGATVEPDPALLNRLREELDGREVAVTSLDTLPSSTEIPARAVAADMQTVAIFARARQLGIAAAAILIVSETGKEKIDDEALGSAAQQAGQTAVKGLSR
jgi:uridine phosphorylase